MFCAWILLLILGSSSAAIYHLNDTEYALMPPLWRLDSHSECMSEHGTYCMVQLQLTAAPGNQLMHTIQEYSEHNSKHYDHSIIDRGVCVTKTCKSHLRESRTTEELKGVLEACLNESLQQEFGLSARVSTLHYCEIHNEPAHIDTWDWTVLAIVFTIVIINCVGSLYDYFLSKQSGMVSMNGNIFLLSFSVLKNWKRLTNITSRDPKSEDLQFLHGARVVAQICTIIMHVVMSLTMGFMSNPHDVEKTFERTIYYLLYNGMMIVQIFFFISGFLTSFIAIQSSEENRNRTASVWDLPKILLLRLSRLVPGLAMTLALTTSWTRHAGSGPLWRLFVSNSLVAECRTNWWHHLLFINNYTHGGSFCLIQTWHIAAELQVFMVAVLAFLLARRHLLSALLVLSALAPAVHTVLQDLDAVFITPSFLRTWEGPTFWGQHALGHTNLSCFIMGMMTATKLYEWKRRGGHLVISRWWSLLQYLSIAAIPAIMLSGSMFYADGPRASLGARALYSSLVRLALSLVCALSGFAFINRTTSYLKSLFESRFWVIPSRLTYGVYLLHMTYIHMMMGYRSELAFYSFNNVMTSTLFILAISLLSAVVLYLTVEAPFIALFKGATKTYSDAHTGHTSITNGKSKTM